MTYPILVVLSSIVITAYLLERVCKRFNIPTVLMLIGMGFFIKQGADLFGIQLPNLGLFLEIFGVIGLIFIVLEGAMELEISSDKKWLIFKAFLMAFLVMGLSALGFMGVFAYSFKISFYTALINAIPFSVVSSAIVIPSVAHLQKDLKEFLTYESAFSDIVGIIAFNALLKNNVLNFASLMGITWDIVAVILLSILVCVGLVYLMNRLEGHSRFLFVMAILVLFYSVGKLWHLSTLVLVLFFGLVMANVSGIEKGLKRLGIPLSLKAVKRSYWMFHGLVAEGTFLVKTLFFVLFGFLLSVGGLFHPVALLLGVCVAAFVFMVRLGFVKVLQIDKIVGWVGPRGLISVILFLQIPEAYRVGSLLESVLVFCVLSSSVVMAFALKGAQKHIPSPENA
ncbi:MAG: cation:proton antiporter [Candidatus Margulisiibacteriota bacterium]